MKKQNVSLSKQILSILLSLLMVVSILPTGTIVAEAAEDGITIRLNELRKIYPQGKYWNHYVSSKSECTDNLNKWENKFSKNVTSHPCNAHGISNSVGLYDCNYFDGGIQCWGFANRIFYDVFGVYASNMKVRYDKKNVSVGDWVRVNNNSHSAIVISRSGNKIKIVEGNRGLAKDNYKCRCGINWDRQISIDTITYYKHASNYDKIKGDTYKATVNSATNITNSSVTLNSSIDIKANVEKVRYWISKNKGDLTDSTIKKFEDTKTVDYRIARTYDKPINIGSYAYNINTFLEKPLTPNTTYYYRAGYSINGKWYYSSNTVSFKTTNYAPTSFGFNNGNNKTDIGIGDTVTISWNASKYADAYIAILKNSNGDVVHTKSDIKGTTYTFPSECFNNADTYYAEVEALNTVNNKSIDDTVTITVHDNVTVTFIDEISGSIITSQEIPYGHDADSPANPVIEGYTFKGWDKDYTNIISDTEINSIHEPNLYSVKFVDGFNNQTIENSSNLSNKYPYNSVISTESYPSAPQHKNYVFVGWSENDYSVKAEAHTIYARYKWNSPYSVITEIKDVVRAKSDTSETINDGYKIDVKITTPSIENGGTTKTIKGRIVVALKTENGRLLNETESSAFVLYPHETEERSKTIEVFVPYEATDEDLAAVTEVYVVDNYSSAGIISNVAKDKYKTAASNADEWQFSNQKPIVGNNGVVAVDDTLNYVTYGLLRKTTKESLETSLNGYTPVSNRWSDVVSSGQIKYVKKWPSIGDNVGIASKGTTGSAYNNTTKVGKTLYDWFNKTPVASKVTDTEKISVEEHQHANIYYHWCCNRNNGNVDHNITATKFFADKTSGNKYYTFHAHYLTVSDRVLDYVYNSKHDKYCYTRNLSSTASTEYRDQCKDSKFWVGRIPVYMQNWTIQRMIYTYQKIESQSNLKANSLNDIPDNSVNTTNQTTNGVSLKTTTETNVYDVTNWYAYKTEVSVSHQDKNQYNISADLGSEYANKAVTIYVYKNNQVSDYTTEYISEATLDSDGKLLVENAQMREPCSTNTGDFTVAVALPGETNALVVGKISAPKALYTVKYFDYDNETVIYQETVQEGDTVTAPSEELLNVPAGFEFCGWDKSTVGVNSDLCVNPLFRKQKLSVTFVDWSNHNVNMIEVDYGEEIEQYLPETTDVDGIDVTWDLSNCETITKMVSGIDENNDPYEITYDTYVITKNTVITTEYNDAQYTVNFISPSEVPATDFDNPEISFDIEESPEIEMISTETATYNGSVDIPEIDEIDDNYIFYGWINVQTGEYLENDTITSNATYYPIYDFAKTAEEPEADIKTGVYTESQTITITTTDSDTVVYYTTDGTNPKTSDTVKEYTQPITLEKSTTLKFYATGMMMNDSAVITELYAINTDTSGVPYHLVTVYSPIDTNVFYALVKDSAKLKINPLTSIEGGTFDGVFFDEEYTDEFYYNAENVTESMTLYAKYTLDTHTVTFKDYDGTVLGNVNVEFGDTAEFAAPTREGYVFIGWDQDVDYIIEDITATAEYVPEDEYATVKLTKNNKSVDVGGCIKLSAIVTPANLDEVKLFWYSEDESVATVDENGYVTAVSPGETKIIVYVNTTGESDECIFTVNPDKVQNLVISKAASFGYDSSGYIRGIGENSDVDSIIKYFENESGVYIYDKNDQLLNDNDIITTNAKVKLINEDNVVDTKTIIMTGDINCDGHIGNADVSMLNQWLAGAIELSYEQQLAGDVNGDGYVDKKDASVISRYLVGKEKI